MEFDSGDIRPSMQEVERALSSLGLPGGEATPAPSLSSVVYRVCMGARIAYLKCHPVEDLPRIRWASRVSERLNRHGLRAPRFFHSASAEPCVQSGGHLFSLAEEVEGIPLTELDLRNETAARQLGQFLARLHQVLNEPPALQAPPASRMWWDDGYPERITRAQVELQALAPTAHRAEMLRALAVVKELRELHKGLLESSTRAGLVHGDFWPGNLIAGRAGLTDIGVIDLENCCMAPFLLDLAQFVDLAYSKKHEDGAAGIDLLFATHFARSYAAQTNFPLVELGLLPTILLAARRCSVLWIVERHLKAGTNALDPLVTHDADTVSFLVEVRERWSEQLAAKQKDN